MGNHELWREKDLNGVETPDNIIIHDPINPTVLCHGHVPIWGRKKTDKWMEKKIGAGFIRRTFSWLLNKYRDTFGGFKITDKDLKNLHSYAVMRGCRTIVLGHKHPKEKRTFKVKGVNIIILPRGFHEVEI